MVTLILIINSLRSLAISVRSIVGLLFSMAELIRRFFKKSKGESWRYVSQQMRIVLGDLEGATRLYVISVGGSVAMSYPGSVFEIISLGALVTGVMYVFSAWVISYYRCLMST